MKLYIFNIKVISLGINTNINAADEAEFYQKIQIYTSQGYDLKSNYNGTAILTKKSYSVGLLIFLIIFIFPAAVIYYLSASDDVVTIKNSEMHQSSENANADESFDAYCEKCGHGLFRDSKFCPGCGAEITMAYDNSIEEIPKENEAAQKEEIQDEVNNNAQPSSEISYSCPYCGQTIPYTDKCPYCGKSLKSGSNTSKYCLGVIIVFLIIFFGAVLAGYLLLWFG